MTANFLLDYPGCRELLFQRLGEPPPGRIQLLCGPRQVGKTTLLLELAQRLGNTAVYRAADGPEAQVPGFWERLWDVAAEVAGGQGKAVVLLDEVHLLADWAAKLKGRWDRIKRLRLPIHVVATGSSALLLGAGSRESLAGRFERLTLPHWTASALSDVFGIEPKQAASLVVTMGAYPGAFALRDDLKRWVAYVSDSIIEPAIGRDVMALGSVRRPALLRQVFGMCVASPAQIVSLQKIQGALQDRGALETVRHYLDLLEGAYLVASLPKHYLRPSRRRAAPPKLVVLSNAFLAAADPGGTLAPSSGAGRRFGALVENACLAHAWNCGQRVSYWREEPFEVDGVLEGDWGKWVIEVKTGDFTESDLRGLGIFTQRFAGYRPLVICDHGAQAAARAGIEAITWQDFLLSGPPAGGRGSALAQ
ncbi:MAG: ATP-binding protein [Actinomycetota bacterium]